VVVCLVTTLLQNFPQNTPVKNFENWSVLGKDMDKSLWLTFWGQPVYHTIFQWAEVLDYPQTNEHKKHHVGGL